MEFHLVSIAFKSHLKYKQKKIKVKSTNLKTPSLQLLMD